MAHCRWAFADFIIIRWPAALSLYLSGLLIGRKFLPYEWTGYGRSKSGWRCPQKNPEDSTVGSVNPYTRDSNLSVVTRYPSIETAQVSPRFISNCLYSWPRFFWKVDNAIHGINVNPVDSAIRFVSDLSVGGRYPPFERLVLGWFILFAQEHNNYLFPSSNPDILTGVQRTTD